VVAEAAARSDGEAKPLQSDAFDPVTVGAVLDLLAKRGRDLEGWVNNAYCGGMAQLDELDDEQRVSGDLGSGLIAPGRHRPRGMTGQDGMHGRLLAAGAQIRRTRVGRAALDLRLELRQRMARPQPRTTRPTSDQ
jgi:hypothetical protein